MILNSRSLCLILLKGSNLLHANNVSFISMYRVSMMNSRQSFLRREKHLKINTRNYINHSIRRYADLDSSCPMPLIRLLYISFMLYMSHFLVSCFFWDTKATQVIKERYFYILLQNMVKLNVANTCLQPLLLL